MFIIQYFSINPHKSKILQWKFDSKILSNNCIGLQIYSCNFVDKYKKYIHFT